MIDFISPAIGAGLGIWNTINQRNAAKRAATQQKEGADRGLGHVERAREIAVGETQRGVSDANRTFGDQTTAAQERAAQAGGEAIDTVNAGTLDANATLQKLLTSQQEQLSPYLIAGSTGAGRYTDLLTNPQDALEKTPGYQFQLSQGLKGLQQSSAARGALQSGGTLKALTQFGQGLASTTYNDAIRNALAGAGIGLDATSQSLRGMESFGAPQAGNTLRAAYYQGETGRDVADMQNRYGLGYGQFAGSNILRGAERIGDLEARAAGQMADLDLAGAGSSAAGTIGAANATTRGIGAVGNAFLDIFGDGGGNLRNPFARKPVNGGVGVEANPFPWE